jgi:Zn-finger nucleic acid-binding protein
MAQCKYCGAPITLAPDVPTVCTYCGRTNDPAPREVEVPVPVEVVQNVVQVQGMPSGAPAELRCPHCHKKLVGVVAKGVELDGCGGCGGIWVNNASARSVLANPEEIFADLAKRAADNARNRTVREKNPRCPVCTAVLDPIKTHGIALDVCGDHGTWFDAFELSQLVHVLTHGSVGDAPGETRQVRCSSCRTPIAQDRANIGPRGPLCEACWRKLQDEEFAAEESAENHRGALIVGGALLGIAGAMLGGGN